MKQIAICIATYKRQEMLYELLHSLQSCTIPDKIESIIALIADNDVNQTAKQVVEKVKTESLGKKVEYVYEVCDQKGLSDIRNSLLRRSYLTSSKYIVFVDDDEFVTPNWLVELEACLLRNHSDAARGPVLPVFESRVSKYIRCWYDREQYPENTELANLTTGNLILDRTSIEGHNIWFDSRFNESGSEDEYFGINLKKKGAKICWASRAIVYEIIPEKRSRLSWLIKRYYRTASTYSFILKIEQSYPKLIRKFIVSLGYLIIGIISLPLILLPIKKKYLGLIKLSEAAGGLVGIIYRPYHEYPSTQGSKF